MDRIIDMPHSLSQDPAARAFLDLDKASPARTSEAVAAQFAREFDEEAEANDDTPAEELLKRNDKELVSDGAPSAPNKKALRIKQGLAAAGVGLLLGTNPAAQNGAEEWIIEPAKKLFDVNFDPTVQEKPGDPVTVKVESRDTPWGIAREHLGSGEEIRPLVDDIVEQSNEDNMPGLQPGEIIELPPRD